MSDDFYLGDVVQISIGNIKNLDANIDFYQKLGLELIGRDVKPYPWANLYDGAVRVVLNQDQIDYFGLTYFARDMQQRGDKLKQMGIEFVDVDFKIGDFYQKIFLDPNGFGISIIGTECNPETMPKTNVKQPVFLGKMGEFAIPVKDLEQSIAFWQKIGYQVCGKYQQPYNWAILMDREMMVIGLHETQDFSKPALTYFSKDMKTQIQKLVAAGISIKDFMKAEDEGNKVAVAPDGQTVFLFTGEV